MGRSDLPIATAASYRYQYVSLLCFGPFLALAIVEAIGLVADPIKQRVLTAATLAGMALALGIPWSRHLNRWTQSRGANLKTELSTTPEDLHFGYSEQTAGRARSLIKRYNLH
jgi:hypothetical protein